MADAVVHSTGTITITNGSASVSGTGTAFDPAVEPGDLLIVDNGSATFFQIIQSIESATAITLVYPWRGPTSTNTPFKVIRGAFHGDPVRAGPKLAEYLQAPKTLSQAAIAAAATATTKASEAAASAASVSASATAATTQAGIATTKAGQAATSETNAAGHASTATTKASEAAASAAAAAATYDAFDDRYLGAKAADPSVDNDGQALLPGALYFNTATNEMRVRNAANTAWVTAYNPTGGAASGITFSPAGTIEATNVQAALAELGTEKLDKAGGTLTGTVTFSDDGEGVTYSSGTRQYDQAANEAHIMALAGGRLRLFSEDGVTELLDLNTTRAKHFKRVQYLAGQEWGEPESAAVSNSITAADVGKFLTYNCATGARTVVLPAVASIWPGWSITLRFINAPTAYANVVVHGNGQQIHFNGLAQSTAGNVGFMAMIGGHEVFEFVWTGGWWQAVCLSSPARGHYSHSLFNTGFGAYFSVPTAWTLTPANSGGGTNTQTGATAGGCTLYVPVSGLYEIIGSVYFYNSVSGPNTLYQSFGSASAVQTSWSGYTVRTLGGLLIDSSPMTMTRYLEQGEVVGLWFLAGASTMHYHPDNNQFQMRLLGRV